MDLTIVGGQLENPRQPGKPTNFGSCNCISIRKLLSSVGDVAKNVLSNLHHLSAVHAKRALVCRDALRGHMRILCDGLGGDSSSRGSHGPIRYAKTGEEKAAERADIERSIRVGKRCNETMLTRDAARDISEADMNHIRGANGKNCVTNSVALHPSESKTLSSSSMSGATHSRCGTHPRALSRKTWPINVSNYRSHISHR